MSIFDREPVNRKDRRKLAKELQKEQTDFRMSAIGRKIEVENQARQKAIERLSQQGISPADLKAEYDKGFKAGYDMAAGNSIKMAYAAICLALKSCMVSERNAALTYCRRWITLSCTSSQVKT